MPRRGLASHDIRLRGFLQDKGVLYRGATCARFLALSPLPPTCIHVTGSLCTSRLRSTFENCLTAVQTLAFSLNFAARNLENRLPSLPGREWYV